MSAAAPTHLHKCTDTPVAPVKTTVHFSITDKVGALDDCLAAIKAMHISLTRIESYVSFSLFFSVAINFPLSCVLCDCA